MRLLAALAFLLVLGRPVAATIPASGLDDNSSGIYPPYSAYRYAKMMPPREQAFYFFGLVDVFMHFDHAREPRTGISRCGEKGNAVNWLKAAIMFDSYIENPKFWGASHDAADIKNLTAIELLEPFLDKYCAEFDLP